MSKPQGTRAPYKKRHRFRQRDYAKAKRCAQCEMLVGNNGYDFGSSVCKGCASGNEKRYVSMHEREQARVALELARFDAFSREVREAAGVPK